MSRFGTITLLSDYGHDDESVGVVKSVIWSIAPEVRVVDLSHGIDPHDVRAGGLALARAVQYLLPGVVVGAVDPGAGTQRRAICLELGGGQSYLVGPDNGLFAPAVGLIGGASAAWILDRTEYQLSRLGSTFDGRDVFAPVAAHLANGVEPGELGSPIDPSLLLPGVLPVAQPNAEGDIECEILWIDRFGNVQVNVDPADVGDWPAVQVVTQDTTRSAVPVRSYAEIPTGMIGVMSDAAGLVAFAVDRASAAADLGASEGAKLTLKRSGAATQRSPVTFSRPVRENPES